MANALDRSKQRRNSLLSKYGTNRQRDELTQADRELLPYIPGAKQEVSEERESLQPLQVIFDILQTGNYASAGLVDEVWKSIQEKKPFPEWVKSGIQGAWDGLTWEKKRTYSDVLRSRLPEEDKEKYGKGMKLGSWETGISPIDIAGFMGDVLLDPTTYLGLGATKAAREAAEAAAKDTVKVWMKEYGEAQFKGLVKNPDEIVERVAKGFKRGGKDAAEKAFKKNEKMFGRQVSDVYNKAYREALTGRGAEVQADLLSRARKVAETQGAPMALPGRDAISDLLSSDVGLGGLIKKLSTETPYAALGERGGRFAGLEFGKSVRDPNVISKSFSAVKNYIRATPTGGKFSDAWWAINNTGPIGAIREAIGIRDPYQKVINAIRRNDDPMANALMSDIMVEGKSIFADLAEEDTKALDLVYRTAESLQKASGAKVSPFDIIADPAKYGINVGNLEVVDDAVKKLEAWNKKNMGVLKSLETEGLIDAPEELNAYIRSMYPNAAPRSRPQNLGATPTIYQHRAVERGEAVEQAVERMKFLYGVSDPQARELVEEINVGAFSTNMEESIIARAVIQAKIEAKAAMKRELKDFGISAKELFGDAAWSKNMNLVDLPEVGLFTVGDKAFEGMLFDKQVKGIIDNFNVATNPGTMQGVQKALATWTSWWKGTALLGPHTKIRNFIDNNMTLYLIHGMKAFDIREDATAVAMAIHAARMSNPKKLLQEFGMTEGVWNRLLSKPVFTDATGKVWNARDVANISRRVGVFSERTLGYTLKSTIEKFQGSDKTNLVFKASHKVDEIVENTARLKSFVMELKNLIPKRAGQGTIKQAIDFASKETKKMFVDYGDLTEMEQKVFKNVIPFWTFMRANLANKLHALLAMPDTFSIFPKLQELAQIEDPDYDPKLIPAYMRNLGMFPAIKGGDGKLGMFNPGLSVADFNKIPLIFEKGHALPKLAWSEFKDDLLASAHPILKTFAEMVPEKGYDTFRKRDIMETSRAPYTFRFIARAPGLLPALDGIMRWIGFEDGIKADVNEDGQLVIDGRMARIMESNLPMLRHIDMLLMGATEIGDQVVEGFAEAVEGATGAKTDYDGLEKFFSLLGYYTGAKFKPVEIQKLKDDLKKDVYYKARDARTKDIRKTQESAERSRKYRQVIEGKVKRIVR